MQISDESFNSLEKYGRAKGEEQKVYLKLAMKDGKLSLQTFTKEEMGLKDKFMSALHMGDFSTKKIAAFISSDPFCKMIESKELTPGMHKAVMNACTAILRKLPNESDKALFKLSIKNIKLHLARENETTTDRVHTVASKGFRPSPLPGQFSYYINKGASLTPHEIQKLQEIGEKRLLDEVAKGIVVIDPKNFSIVLPTKNHWYNQLVPYLDENLAMQLQNKVMIHQELHLAKSKLGDNDLFRKQILALICKNKGLSLPSSETISKAKAHALEALLQNKDLLDKDLPALPPKELRQYIDWQMHQAILLAHGIPEKEILDWNNIINAIGNQVSNVFHNTKIYIEKILSQPKIQSLPPIAKKALSLRIQGELYTKANASTDKAIEQFINAEPLKDNTAMVKLSFIQLMLKMSLRKDFIAIHHEVIRPHLAFFTKWQGNLKTEMSQGIDNPDEILDKGVCYALSLRWVRDAIKRSAITPEEKHAIGPKDRFHQAVQEIDPQLLATGSADVEKSFGLRSALRIESKGPLTGKDQIQKQLLKTIDDPRFEHPYNGVAQLLFTWTTKEGDPAGHAITMVLQENTTNPEKSIFSFSDPNFGTFEFPVTGNNQAATAHARQQCLSALSDLLTHMYNKKIDRLNVNCFRI